ncbi:MAG TPA: metallophosphoesterase family protein [Anaeromyxobacteraceae bacterium]|nr:metallophosphoesterase family protein [Anaeromyxobacteraceae bacterium]
MLVGLVSDSHGLADPKLRELFRGVALVLHAGDVVKPAVLDALADVAPVRAVRGNNDLGPSFDALPEFAVVELEALAALVVHDVGPRERPRGAVAALLRRHRPQLVVHGHSHRPGHALLDGVLFVNPGSAGPRRFSLPRTAARLEVRGRLVRVEWFDLAHDRPMPFGEPVSCTL